MKPSQHGQFPELLVRRSCNESSHCKDAQQYLVCFEDKTLPVARTMEQ